MGVRIESLTAEQAANHRAQLTALLQDAVDGGASVGFLPPLPASEASLYWDGVIAAVRDGLRVLLVAVEDEGRIVGTAQLALETRPNGVHRAEVAKVMVLGRARRQGIARALMAAIEEHARRLRRTTLVLDTLRGDPAERLYEATGYTYVGSIPAYARVAGGALAATAVYYRIVDAGA